MFARIVIVLTGIGSLFIAFLAEYSMAFAFVAPASVPLGAFSTLGFLVAILAEILYFLVVPIFLIRPLRTPIYLRYFLIIYGVLATCLSGFQILASAVMNWARRDLFTSDIVGVVALVLSIGFVVLLIVNEVKQSQRISNRA